MTDIVTPLFGGEIRSDEKAAWLDQVAQAYDRFVEHRGHAEALILVQIGGGKVRSAWHIKGVFKNTNLTSSALLIAAEHLRRKAFVDEMEADPEDDSGEAG